MSRTSIRILLCSFISACATQAIAATVHLDKDLYIVNGPGEQFEVQILIDGNSMNDGDDPVRGGLFSFGTKMTFDSTKAEVDSMTVVPALDFFGFNAGATVEIKPGSAGAEGNIDQFENPLVPYEDALLATLTVTNNASAVDSYPLTLDFFRDLAPTEQQFINGDGVILDPTIDFVGARVLVVPEPVTCFSFTLGLSLCLTFLRTRSRMDSRASHVQNCRC